MGRTARTCGFLAASFIFILMSVGCVLASESSGFSSIMPDDPDDAAAAILLQHQHRSVENFNMSMERRQARTLFEDLSDISADDVEALSEEERLLLIEELKELNMTDVEELPQPEHFVSQIRKIWRHPDKERRRLKSSILKRIMPSRKSRPTPRGPPPQGTTGPQPHRHPHPHANRRKDHPQSRRPRPPQRDEVIGHQLPPLPFYPKRPMPAEHRRVDNIQDALASNPAPRPFLFKVPGEGVIKLPPPPSYGSGSQVTPAFPPPFPIGAVPGGRPDHHDRRRPQSPANRNEPRRPTSVKTDQSRRPPPPRRPHDRFHPRQDQFRPRIPSASEVEEYLPHYHEDDHEHPHVHSDGAGDFSQPPSIEELENFIHNRPAVDPFRVSPDQYDVRRFDQFSPVTNNGIDAPVARRECDFYSDNICLESDVYPFEAIRRSLSRESPLTETIFAEVRLQSADTLVDGVSSQQEERYDYSHYFGGKRPSAQERQGSVGSHSHRDFAQEGGYLCPSEVKYARPQRARNSKGDWKFIVNMERYTQTLRMEKCMRPGASCSYVSHHYKSQCSQVFNYHRLLSWDDQRGLHMDIFKVPVACSCHIQGYSYVYPPLDASDIGTRLSSNIQENVKIARNDEVVRYRSTFVNTPQSTVHQSTLQPPYPTLLPPRPTTTLAASSYLSTPTATVASTTTVTTSTTQSTTVEQQDQTVSNNPRRRFRNRLRPLLTRRPISTFPPYRRRNPISSTEDSSDPDLRGGSRDGGIGGGFGDRITGNELRRRNDVPSDNSVSDSRYPPEIRVPPPRHPPPPLLPDEEKVNYGYHPIIDFFGSS